MLQFEARRLIAEGQMGAGMGKYSLLLKEEGEGWLQSCSKQEESVTTPGDFVLAGQTQAELPQGDLSWAEELTPCAESAHEHPIIYQGTCGVSRCPYMALQDGTTWPSTTPLLAPCSWGFPIPDWMPVVLKLLLLGWRSWNTFLFSPSAIPGPG